RHPATGLRCRRSVRRASGVARDPAGGRRRRSVSVREFLLPDLGEGLEDAEVQAWHVAEGDRVELNQTLVEVNTAKAVVEIPAPWAGVVQRLHAEEGDVVKVGHPLVSIQVEDAAAPEAEAGSEASEAQQAAQEVGAEAAEA